MTVRSWRRLSAHFCAAERRLIGDIDPSLFSCVSNGT
jgi:hypothetical protein